MSDDYPSRTLDRIMIRLPDGMRDRLAEVARENKRSVNAEVVARLEASFSTGSLEMANEIVERIVKRIEAAAERRARGEEPEG